MIVPDVNLLVYAYNRDSSFHDAARNWWERCLSGSEPVGLSWMVVLGFARVVSSRRAVAAPMSVDDAFAECRRWLAEPCARILAPGPSHLDVLEGLLRGPAISSSLVMDAHLAALAIEHQAELHSNDWDFARFSGLRWRNPVA